ncbi:MAG: GNAT family N-acetyltransferase, partial [Celeribacter marinus]
GERVMDLHHLFVDEAHRGRGIGRALINASHDLARTLGCGRITVGTMTTNIAAQKAYVACGFVPVPMTGKRFSMAVA